MTDQPLLRSEIQAPAAGLFRRFGAMVSDTLVVLGMLILATFMTTPPLLSVLNKKALVPSEVGWFWTGLYWALMLVIWATYFVLLWSRTGQTVGMRAWRLRVQMTNGSIPTTTQALIRLWWAAVPWIPGYLMMGLADRIGSAALESLGWLLLFGGAVAFSSMLLRSTKETWHDKMSLSRIILLPKL